MPAPTSVPMPKRTPCSTWRAIGKIPEARKAFERRAVRDGGACGREPLQLVVGDVDVVGQHRALAQQARALVGVDVVAGLGEELA